MIGPPHAGDHAAGVPGRGGPGKYSHQSWGSAPGGQHRVTYLEGAPHPPSERRTDAGQLPPWLLGVVCLSPQVRPGTGVATLAE